MRGASELVACAAVGRHGLAECLLVLLRGLRALRIARRALPEPAAAAAPKARPRLNSSHRVSSRRIPAQLLRMRTRDTSLHSLLFTLSEVPGLWPRF